MTGSLMPVSIALAQAVALLWSVAFITYAVVIVLPFLRYQPRAAGDALALDWHLFVPALNEEQVLGQTIDYLRATLPRAHVWIVDDGSEDATAALARRRAGSDPLVHLTSRRRPDARTGKGNALNAAYQALNAWLPASADRRGTVIGVIDADGRPAPNCLDVCAGPGLFGDPAVGSVQILVRMINRDDRRPFPHRGRLVNALGNTLVRLQDLEFRVPISAIQLTRRETGTVGLGGNGQFSRLSALDVVAGEAGRPWRGALLEDYELSLQLMLAGQRIECTQDTCVDQEALPDIRRLVRQRTRWGQGTMQCGRYLRQLWTSPHMSALGALEATYYLCQPWLQLAGTFVYPIPAIVFIANCLAGPHQMGAWVIQYGWWVLVFYLTLGLGPFVLWGPVYRKRCEPGMGFVHALGLGVGYSLFVLLFYITAWRAFFRILWHRSDWHKTLRNAELAPDSHRPGQQAQTDVIVVLAEITGAVNETHEKRFGQSHRVAGRGHWPDSGERAARRCRRLAEPGLRRQGDRAHQHRPGRGGQLPGRFTGHRRPRRHRRPAPHGFRDGQGGPDRELVEDRLPGRDLAGAGAAAGPGGHVDVHLRDQLRVGVGHHRNR
jgi:1,2-diacylglycerol 3-beta-glucosyltransferase